MNLEERVRLLEDALVGLVERLDGIQESLKNLALENQAIRLQLKERDHGRTLMGHLERQ